MCCTRIFKCLNLNYYFYYCSHYRVIALLQPILQSYPGCEDVPHNDFTSTVIVSHTALVKDNTDTTLANSNKVRQLVRMELLYNKDANDFAIFFGGFEGLLLRYNPIYSSISVIKDLKTIQGNFAGEFKQGDHALTGIKFHPNFQNNRWLFLFYTPRRFVSNEAS